MNAELNDLDVPSRILLGPGPSDVDPRVLRALGAPVLGHLDPVFLQVMDEVRELLQGLFKTENPLTVAMPGTGSAGMETCLVNLLEPGDRALICVAGFFGERMVDMAGRCGARVDRLDAEWGRSIDPGQVRRALAQGSYKVVGLVHAETSTGVLQPVAEIARACREQGALLVLDAVTSLGGAPVEVDAWGVAAAYSCTQKCLGSPPGLAPVTFGEGARRALRARKTPVHSWYLDLGMIEDYWGRERFYHHTAPISMVYALREALRLVAAEGLPTRWERHRILGGALQAGLLAMGLELLAPAELRAPMLTSVRVPAGVEDLAVRRRLLDEFGIEVGGGLGPLKGRIWRVGLMGYSCRWRNVVLFLTALGEVLARAGVPVDPAAGLRAAQAAAGKWALAAA